MTSSLGLIWNSERYSRPRAMNTSESGCCQSTLTRPPDSPSALAVSGKLMIGIFDMAGSPASRSQAPKDAAQSYGCPAGGDCRAGLIADVERLGDGEDVVDIIELDTGRRCAAADEVEDPAVLES